MGKYKSNGILIHNGSTVWPGDELELTDEQAVELGARVLPLEVADPEKPLDEYLLKDLKSLAKKAGITGYSGKDKGTLVTELSALSEDAEVSAAPSPDEVEVVADEPSGD